MVVLFILVLSCLVFRGLGFAGVLAFATWQASARDALSLMLVFTGVSHNGVAHHIGQNMDFAIVAAAEPILLRAYARERGWHNLRLLSAGESSFKYDLGGENQDGGQDSALNVFTKSADGTARHFYTQHPRLAQDISERGIDLLTPVFNLMDLTPAVAAIGTQALRTEPKPMPSER